MLRVTVLVLAVLQMAAKCVSVGEANGLCCWIRGLGPAAIHLRGSQLRDHLVLDSVGFTHGLLVPYLQGSDVRHRGRYQND